MSEKRKHSRLLHLEPERNGTAIWHHSKMILGGCLAHFHFSSYRRDETGSRKGSCSPPGFRAHLEAENSGPILQGQTAQDIMSKKVTYSSCFRFSDRVRGRSFGLDVPGTELIFSELGTSSSFGMRGRKAESSTSTHYNERIII